MSKKVLLVDDSKTIREIIKIYLMGRDIRFYDADNGVRGLQLARIMDVDLIIVDVKMPEMDGITFMRELRAAQLPGARRTPAVLLTGETGEDLRKRGLEAGADDFLLKPVKAEQMREIYQRFVAHAPHPAGKR